MGAVLSLVFLSACNFQESRFSGGQNVVDRCIETACDTLDLDELPLRNYSQLNETRHVTTLSLQITDFADLEEISGMTQLRELRVNETDIQDFLGLSAFGNLEVLWVSGFDPATLGRMPFPPSIRELGIGHETLEDVAMLPRMPALERLSLGRDSSAFDLAPLGAHEGLLAIYIRNGHSPQTGPLDLAPLLELPNLQEISFPYEPSDPAGIAVVEALRARGVEVTINPSVILF